MEIECQEGDFVYLTGTWGGSAMIYFMITDFNRQWLILYLWNGQVEFREHKSLDKAITWLILLLKYNNHAISNTF